MKSLLILSLALLSISAFGQSQGVSMRATNGIGYGNTVIHNLTGEIGTGNVTNAAGSRVAYLSDTNGLGPTTVYASNVVSGGVLPAGTVSASMATAGYVLATDGTLRQWTNRATITTIDGPTTVNGALTNTGYSSTTTNYATKLRVGGSAESANAVSVTGTIDASSTITGNAVVGSTQLSTAGSGNVNASGRGIIYFPRDGIISIVNNNGTSGSSLLFGGGTTTANQAGSTNWPMLVPGAKTNGLLYAELSVMAGTNTTEFASIKADQVTSTNRVTGNRVTITNGSVLASMNIIATNGIASYRSNLLVAATITVGASPSSWTNTLSPECSVNVYVDSSLGATTVGQNGATLFGSFAGTQTVGLQPGEYVTFTYLATAPTAKFKPFP